MSIALHFYILILDYSSTIKPHFTFNRLLTKANGYPRPTVKWYADNIPVEVTEVLTLETYEDGTEALTIPHTTLDDCGEYTCEAMNRNGVDTTVTTLVVLPGMHYGFIFSPRFTTDNCIIDFNIIFQFFFLKT